MKRYLKLVYIFFGYILLCGFSFGKLVLDEPSKEYLNPDYVEYEKLSDEEKKEYNVIPDKYIYNLSANAKVRANGEDIASSLPTSFTLAPTDGTRYVPAMKNQGNAGLCWSFAANTALESYLLKHNMGSYNFSENANAYVGYLRGDIASITSGNTLTAPYLYWSLGNGPVSETLFGPYTDTPDFSSKAVSLYMDNDNVGVDVREAIRYTPYNLQYTYTTYGNSYSVVTSVYSPIWNEIKNNIMNNGAVETFVYAHSSLYNAANNTFYYDGATSSSLYSSSSHAVSIIGWDDNKYVPSSDSTPAGAWLVQNSWGDEYSYFWISYYDRFSNVYMMGITEATTKEYDNAYTNYYENPVSYTSDGYNSYKFYIGDNEETLDAVRFFVSTNPDGLTYPKYHATVVSNGNKYASTDGEITMHLGTNTFDFGDGVKLSGIVEVKIYGAVGDNLNVTLLTKEKASLANTKDIFYTGDNTSKYISTSVGTELNYQITSKNIPSGTLFNVVVTDQDNVDITDSFTIDKSDSLINNYGTLKVTTNELLDTSNIKIKLIAGMTSTSINYATISLDGTGTKTDPLIIKNPQDLIAMQGSNSYFKLNNNIDLYGLSTNKNDMFNPDGYGWKSIDFKGKLDGNNKTISGLKSNNGGLFYTLYDSEINNLRINDFYVKCDYTSLEEPTSCGLLGNYSEDSIINNIEISESKLIGNLYAGALFGSAVGNTINNINIKNNDLSASFGIGGLIGLIQMLPSQSTSIGDVFVDNNKIHVFRDEEVLNAVSSLYEYSDLIPGYLSFAISYNGYSSSLPLLTLSGIYYTSNPVTGDNNPEYPFTYESIKVYDSSTGNIISDYDTDSVITISNYGLLDADKAKVSSNYIGYDFTNTWVVNADKAILKNFVPNNETAISYDLSTYEKKSDMIILPIETKKEDIISKLTIDSTLTYKMYNKNNIEVSDTSVLGTGSYITITNGRDTRHVPIIVYGDVTGDGVISIGDVMFVADYSLLISEEQINNFTSNEFQVIAANVIQADTTGVNVADVKKIADYSLNPSGGW